MKKIIAGIALAVIIIAGLRFGYSKFHNGSAVVINEQRKIDSLTNEIAKLDSEHVKSDSVITMYHDSVVFVDRMIETEKTKYVQIKHKYDEIRNHVVRYTPTQLDSFFSSRYGHLKSDSSVSDR